MVITKKLWEKERKLLCMPVIKLTKLNTLTLEPSTPFDFNSTFYKPAHFPSSDTKWEKDKRWQTMLWKGEKLGLIFKDIGKKVEVEIYSQNQLSPTFLENLKNELVWRYNFNLDLHDFYQAVENEPTLKEAIKRFYGLRPMHPESLYEYLIIAIVLQNATVRRSVSMMQALFENYGTEVEFDNQKFWCFWEPETLAKADEQELRALKMGYRAKSLIKVSTSFSDGQINELELRNKRSEEQEQVLLSLYGIGPASVGYIMFDVFHHWDYLKNISPWEQKIYTKIFFNKDYETDLVPVSIMLKTFEKWGKWKNLAIHYLWEDIWWKRRNEHIPWLEKLIRL